MPGAYEMVENENYLLERVIRVNKEEYNLIQASKDHKLNQKKKSYIPLKYKKGRIKMSLFFRKSLLSFNMHNLATKTHTHDIVAGNDASSSNSKFAL